MDLRSTSNVFWRLSTLIGVVIASSGCPSNECTSDLQCEERFAAGWTCAASVGVCVAPSGDGGSQVACDPECGPGQTCNEGACEGEVCESGCFDDGVCTPRSDCGTCGECKWVEGPSMPIAGNVAAVRLADGRVLVAGGVLPNGSLDPGSALYSPATNTWELAGQMARARRDPGLLALPNGDALACGGYESQAPSTACERFIASSKVWVTAPRLNHARSNPALILVRNDTAVLAVGGTAEKSSELYDLQEHAWTLLGLTDLSGSAAAIKLDDGRVLAMGRSGGETASHFFYPVGETWGPAPVPPGGFASWPVKMLNGDVLFINSVGLSGPEAYRLGPNANAWTPISFPTLESYVDLIVRPSGKVLAVPVLGSSELASTEIYDPQSGLWSAGPSLNKGRNAPAVIQLEDGKVLVAGGSIDDGATLAATSSTELLR